MKAWPAEHNKTQGRHAVAIQARPTGDKTEGRGEGARDKSTAHYHQAISSGRFQVLRSSPHEK